MPKAGEETMIEPPTQGPAVVSKPDLRPYDYSRFTRLMDGLQKWRDDDHEDTILLYRSDMIEIIEGINALRRGQ
jgi:hypothetical protein